MTRETITANSLQTISWFDNSIVDWASAGVQYLLDGREKQLGKYSYSPFDSSIISPDGQYAFIYQKLGTKGLLLKRGEILREIKRSYYCAEVYEYPAAFLVIKDITYLVHCPLKYCRLDFENVETGELITDVERRDPSDFFHSRLEINAGSTFLMSKGWFWHPLDAINVHNIADCIDDPLLLDEIEIYPRSGTEICTASFIDETTVLIGSSEEVFNDEILDLPPNHIAVWDILSDEISNIAKVNCEFGNLFAINDTFAWDTFNFPKIINIKTGEIVEKDESVYSGRQKSSMIGDSDKFPQIVFNRETKQLAISGKNKIDILTPSNLFM